VDVPSARRREESLQTINSDLIAAMNWSNINQMKFSSAKSQSLLFSRKRDKNKNGPVILDGSVVKDEATLNLLGVNFSGDGTVSEHLLAKARTAGKLVSMLRRNKMFLSVKARAQVYFSCIRPVMEYACPLFVKSTGYALKALDRIDARAKRLFPTIPTDTLSHRRDIAGLCVMRFALYCAWERSKSCQVNHQTGPTTSDSLYPVQRRLKSGGPEGSKIQDGGT